MESRRVAMTAKKFPKNYWIESQNVLAFSFAECYNLQRISCGAVFCW